MDERRVEHFVVLAEELNFTRAARRLHLTQQTLSSSIQALERELRVRLFTRSTRSVALTDTGRRLLPTAAAFLDAGRAVRRAAADPARRPVLRVGLFLGQVAAAELTAPILSAFRAARPDVTLQVTVTGFNDYLTGPHDDLDLSIVRGPVDETNLDFLPLFEEPRVAYLSTRHPLADAAVITADDLATVAGITAAPPAPGTWSRFYGGLDVVDERPITAQTATMEQAYLEALDHHSVGTTGACMRRLLPWPGITFRPLDQSFTGSVTGLVTPGRLTDEAQSFLDTTQRVVSDEINPISGAFTPGQ